MSEKSSEIHRRQLQDLTKLSGDALNSLLLSLKDVPLAEWAEAIRAIYPNMILQFGNTAAVLAADYYNDRRAAVAPKGSPAFKATTNDADRELIKERTTTQMDYIINSVFIRVEAHMKQTGEEITSFKELPASFQDEIINKFQTETDHKVLMFDRELTVKASREDPSKVVFKRNVNASGCPFCRLLALQGVINADEFHKGCKCTVDLVAPSKANVETQADKDFKKKYEAAQEAMGGTASDSEIVSWIMEHDGTR